MKKHFFSIIALAVALGALALALAGYRAQAARLDTLEAQMDDVLAELARREAGAETDIPEATAGEAQAFCNLVILGWSTAEGALTIDVFAQASLPEGASISDAQLLLIHEDSVQSQEITLYPGEGEAGFEAEVSTGPFSIPQMADADALELELQVTFTGGKVISAYGASWYAEDGQLLMISG